MQGFWYELYYEIRYLVECQLDNAFFKFISEDAIFNHNDSKNYLTRYPKEKEYIL